MQSLECRPLPLPAYSSCPGAECRRQKVRAALSFEAVFSYANLKGKRLSSLSGKHWAVSPSPHALLITLIKVKSDLQSRARSPCDYRSLHPHIYILIASLGLMLRREASRTSCSRPAVTMETTSRYRTEAPQLNLLHTRLREVRVEPGSWRKFASPPSLVAHRADTRLLRCIATIGTSSRNQELCVLEAGTRS